MSDNSGMLCQRLLCAYRSSQSDSNCINHSSSSLVTQQLFFVVWSGKDHACDYGIHFWHSCCDPSRAKKMFFFSEESQSASGIFLAKMTCLLLLQTERLQALQGATSFQSSRSLDAAQSLPQHSSAFCSGHAEKPISH